MLFNYQSKFKLKPWGLAKFILHVQIFLNIGGNRTSD